MKEAFDRADGRKIDGRRVLVDVERGRTVKGWKPRSAALFGAAFLFQLCLLSIFFDLQEPRRWQGQHTRYQREEAQERTGWRRRRRFSSLEPFITLIKMFGMENMRHFTF